MIPLLAATALAVFAVALGERLCRLAGPPDGRRAERWSVYLLAGLAAAHLLWLLLDAAGIPWTRISLTVTGSAALAGLSLAVRPRRTGVLPPAEPAARASGGVAPWGLAAGGIAVALYGYFAWILWSVSPDFIYHWGIKGHRYFLARGIDWSFLADPLRLTDHPDYPNLLPDLFATSAVLAGRFDVRAALLWSVLLFAVLLPLARQTWRRLRVAGWGIELGTVALAASTAMFGIGYWSAGGADLAITAALMAAAPSLVSRHPAPGDDLRLGVAAAFAAGSKMEGLPLAGFLIAVYLGRRLLTRRDNSGIRGLLAPSLRAALPAALVTVPWAVRCSQYDLWQPSNSGRLDLARAADVFPALAETFATPEWHGLAWLVPLALPVLLAVRRTRPIAAVCALQLGFYLWVYLASPLEPAYYVLSSFPRLLFHLLPAVLTATVAWVADEEAEAEVG